MKKHLVKLKKYSWLLCLLLLITACLTVGTVLGKYKTEIEVGAFNISIIPSPQAYAVYSADDSSLVFYYGILPEENTSLNGKTVTAIYHNNIITTEYNCILSNSDASLASSSVLPEWKDVAASVTSVSFDESFRLVTPVSTSGWFYNFVNLKSIDCTNLNTSAVTSMQGMFAGCKTLESLDVSSFDTQNVKNMKRMFSSCNALTSLNITGFDTGAVENMSFMFAACWLLPNLNVSHFVTSEVNNMRAMFAECRSLTQLSLSNFNTEKVTDMQHMFRENANLSTLDLSNFNTSLVKDMQLMFASCTGLTSLNISSFDTAAVKSMYMMFHGCSNVSSLDLSSFNTKNVNVPASMFSSCISLRTIYASSTFVFRTSIISDATKMFDGCILLEGGNGTKYNSANKNLPFAHIDGAGGEPGYFTAKPHDEHGTATYTDNADGTHTRYCGVYGEPIQTEAHTYTEGKCVCGKDEVTQ